jgi:hypothetical protein
MCRCAIFIGCPRIATLGRALSGAYASQSSEGIMLRGDGEVDEAAEPRQGSKAHRRCLLTVNSCIKVRLDLQADKSHVVVKGPFFPRVVNPRYRIRGTNV